MSDPTEPVATNNGPPNEDLSVSVEDIINSFLELNPEPTEEQVHTLAASLGMTPEDFEAVLYAMFGELVNENVEPEDLVGDEDGDDDEEEVDYDETEVFLILYFMRNPKPSDAQIHALAKLINMSTEQIEETIFRLLSEFEAEADNDDDEEGQDESVVEPPISDPSDETAAQADSDNSIAPPTPGAFKIDDQTPMLAGTHPAASDVAIGKTVGSVSVPGGGSGDAPAVAAVSSAQTPPASV